MNNIAVLCSIRSVCAILPALCLPLTCAQHLHMNDKNIISTTSIAVLCGVCVILIALCSALHALSVYT